MSKLSQNSKSYNKYHLKIFWNIKIFVQHLFKCHYYNLDNIAII